MVLTKQKIQLDHPACPAALRQAMQQAGVSAVWTLGNTAILEAPLLGLFCSQKCPGDLIIRTFDTIRQLRDAGVPVIGGFHAPMEKECLDLLLRGTQPVVVCPARSIEGMRVPDDWKPPLAEGRLLVLSLFKGKRNRRMTTELAQARNRFVSLLASAVLMPYATPGGATEGLCRGLLASGTRVYTLDSEHNSHLIEIGAEKTMPARISEIMDDLAAYEL